MYYQLNSTSTEEFRDEKTYKIKQLVHCYSVQCVVMCKYCTNFGNIRSSRCPALWFNDNRVVKAIETWNKDVAERTYLPGGTGMIGVFKLYKVMKTSNVVF
jgi:hypothetical protein